MATIPYARDITAVSWDHVAAECYNEMSAEGKKALDLLCVEFAGVARVRFEELHGYSPRAGMGVGTVRELLVALIGNGYLREE